MIRNRRMRVEEYVPTATLLLQSLLRDRIELVDKFSDFTMGYVERFKNQLHKIKALQMSLNMTGEQIKATEDLFIAVDLLNKDLNFLSFQFKQANLESDLLAKVKYDLVKRNIEGACLKMEDLIKFISNEHLVLESKGMNMHFPESLNIEKEDLVNKNKFLNNFKNNIGQLYLDHREDFNLLYDFMSTVSEAGRILYDGKEKEDEYTISKIIGKMRVEKVEDSMSLAS